MAHAGAFMSIEVDGSLRIERGYVRPEDEPAADDTMGDPERTVDPETGEIRTAPDGSSPTGPAVAPVGTASSADDAADDELVKPLPDKLVSELTVWSPQALQHAVAQSHSTARSAARRGGEEWDNT